MYFCCKAIQAAVLSGNKTEDVQDFLLLDITPLSLGTSVEGGLMSVLIKRNTTIPACVTQAYHTTDNNQIGMTIDVSSFNLICLMSLSICIHTVTHLQQQCLEFDPYSSIILSS